MLGDVWPGILSIGIGLCVRYQVKPVGIYKAGLVWFFPHMLMLMFRVDDEPWALSTDDIQDLIPLVALQPCVHLADNVVGLLNYHGEHLPVIDVSAMVGKRRSPEVFSTRIAIVAIESVKLGLILDRAYETVHLHNAIDMPIHNPFIQAMLQSSQGLVVQQLALQPVLQQISSTA